MPDRADASAADPFAGRQPTSHERMTGEPWDTSYAAGPAPWDIGGPQPAMVRLAAEGAFVGPVLDVGCGTGDNALHMASLGLDVLAVDVAETALTMAREKAASRGLAVEFAVADAFRLDRLGRTFRTVLDSGMFHTCDADERPVYAASLASATGSGGSVYVLCFADRGSDAGPHPVREDDIRAAFTPGGGWRIVSIEPERVETRFGSAPAWLARIERT
jgi:SAM-dependent methyltransferase